MISKYKIYVDAAADIPADVRERYDIGCFPFRLPWASVPFKAAWKSPTRNSMP